MFVSTAPNRLGHASNVQPIRVVLWTVAAVSGLCMMPSAANAGVINAAASDLALVDTNGDDLGDARVASGNTAYQMGESSADQNEVRLWIPFTLSTADRTDIANADSVSFSFNLQSLGNVSAFNVDLHGFSGRTSAVAVNSDYEAATTLLVDNALTASSPVGAYSFDVTNFARTQSAIPGSVIVFRLQMDPATLPNNDGLWNRYVIALSESTTPPQLTIVVPEPASMALLGLGTLILACRWTRCVR